MWKILMIKIYLVSTPLLFNLHFYTLYLFYDYRFYLIFIFCTQRQQVHRTQLFNFQKLCSIEYRIICKSCIWKYKKVNIQLRKYANYSTILYHDVIYVWCLCTVHSMYVRVLCALSTSIFSSSTFVIIPQQKKKKLRCVSECIHYGWTTLCEFLFGYIHYHSLSLFHF